MLNGAAICIGAFAVLHLAGCAEVLDAEGAQGDAQLAAATTEAKPANNMLRLAADVEARGSLATALPLYENAASMPNADPSAQTRLAETYVTLGRFDEGAAAYRAAIAKQPDNGAAMLGLGGLLLRLGKAEEGVIMLSKAAPLVNSARAYDRLGVAHIAMGQPREALASFTQARSLDPQDLDIASNLTLATALVGQKDDAVKLAKETLAKNGVQDYQRRNLMLAMCIAGQEDEAKRAASSRLGESDVDALIKHAREIRQMPTPKARALALATARPSSAATN
jgi:Tfp pilus assembly protein PilF